MDYEEIFTGDKIMTYEEIMRRAAHQVENCDFLFKCPQQWDKMGKTERDEVRFCAECRKEVFFVKSMQSLKEFREAGKCVALWHQVGRKDADEQQTDLEKVAHDPPPQCEILAGVVADTSKVRETSDIKNENDNQLFNSRQKNGNSLEKSGKSRFPELLGIIIGLLVCLILLGIIIKFLLVRF